MASKKMTEVIADNFQMLGSKMDRGDSGGDIPMPTEEIPSSDSFQSPGDQNLEDDLPF